MTSARAAGLLVTAQNLRKKLAELKKRESEVEDNKGFSQKFSLGGASKKFSEEDAKEDIAAQKAMISELLAESQLAQLREQQKEQKEKEKNEDEIKFLREFASFDEAKNLAESIKKNLEQKGFSCEISEEGNRVKLEINSGPKDFDSKNMNNDFLENVANESAGEVGEHAAAVLAKREAQKISQGGLAH